MKLLNTRDIKHLLEEEDIGYDFFDLKNEAGPCREIKIDHERHSIVLLVDNRELISQTFENFGSKSLSMEQVDKLLSLWRQGKMEELYDFLKLPIGES